MNPEVSFFEEKPDKLLSRYRNIDSSEWQKKGEQFALDLFQKTATEVPAYKDFLKKNKVKPEKVKSIEDFKLVPPVDKEDYLLAYPLKSLGWGGKLDNLYMLSSSSGSTGTPFLWPRGAEEEVDGARFVELFYKYMFEMDKKPTLYVVSFGMGAWIAGTFMTNVTQMVAKKGYPITIMTPGLEKDLLINLIKQLKNSFEQILIIGYPPFVKDILDSGKDHHLDWTKLNVKLMFAAEGFTEEWRNYVLNKIGAKRSLKTTTNIYGTADAGIMGMETPLSILFRRILVEKDKIKEIFGETRQPTVVQYDPTQKFFEKIGQELVFTANAGLPLIRYNIHDNGDILFYEEVERIFTENGISLEQELKRFDCEAFNWKIPFIYIFGRTDFMVNFYGLNVFPEHIKSGLEDIRVNNLTTGKFTMHTDTDTRHNQKLILNIELQEEVDPNSHLNKLILDTVLKHLKQLNSEFNKLYSEIGPKKASPQINLLPYGDSQFKIGAKHRWVQKKTQG